MDLTAAFAALFVLRPMLARHHRQNEAAAQACASATVSSALEQRALCRLGDPSRPGFAGAFFLFSRARIGRCCPSLRNAKSLVQEGDFE